MFVQVFSARRRVVSAGRRSESDAAERLQRLVSVRLQSGAGDRRERALAIVRPVRRRAERQSDARSIDAQVQGLRLRDDDQLRRGSVSRSRPERIRPGQSGSASLVQEDQEQWWARGARIQSPGGSRQRIFVHVQPLMTPFYSRSTRGTGKIAYYKFFLRQKPTRQSPPL